MDSRMLLIPGLLAALLTSCHSHERGHKEDGWHECGGHEPMAVHGAHDKGPDAVDMFLYPPELVLHAGPAVGVGEDVMLKIRKDVYDTQLRVVDLEPRLKKAQLGLQQTLSLGELDEAKVSAQIDEASRAETEIKKQHMGLLLRIRQMLTPEQRSKLDHIKGEQHERMAPGIGAPPAPAPPPLLPPGAKGPPAKM